MTKELRGAALVVCYGYLAAAIYVLLLAFTALAFQHAKQRAADDQHTGANESEGADDLGIPTVSPQPERSEYRCCAATHVEHVSHWPSLDSRFA